MVMKLNPQTDAVLVVDTQDPFMNSIASGELVLRRSEFLVRSALELGVPVLATEQMPDKLGPLHPSIRSLLNPDHVFAKSTFSSYADPAARAAMDGLRRSRWVLVGAETHICVAQTALDLLESGLEVVVCPDALGARCLERHKLGMERMRDSAVMPVHTEGVVYEWLHSSGNPHFRSVLKIVKQFA